MVLSRFEMPTFKQLETAKNDLLLDIEEVIIENIKHFNGQEIEDPDKFWELIVPDEEFYDPNYVGALSYKKVKRHEYIMHPRDRIKKKP